MNNRFINDKRYNWKVKKTDYMYVAYIGRYQSVKKLLVYLEREDAPKLSSIKKILKTMTGNFAIVVETDNWLLGLVDRISGYRLFYRNNQNGCIFQTLHAD